MTNDQFPIPNGGARAARCQITARASFSLLAIGHWDLVIPAIIRERVRE
jgi:hypothetical protein